MVLKYRPDGIWFDYGFGNLLPEPAQMELAQFYYNQATANGQELAFIHKHGSRVPSGMLDKERDRPGTMQEKTFMNDESIGRNYWFYSPMGQSQRGSLKGAYLVHMLADLVSKNGVLLLNVAPDHLGNIPQHQLNALNTIGSWLKIYGDSIYNTRPWETYGEGPFQKRFKGYIGARHKEMMEYTGDDIRFSRSKDQQTVYAIFMGKPQGALPITSMKVTDASALQSSVELSGGKVTLNVNDQGNPVVSVDYQSLPESLRDIAHVVAIPATAIAFDATSDTTLPMMELSIDHARLKGDSINLIAVDSNTGIRVLEPWTDPGDSISWKFEIPSEGTWALKSTLNSPGYQKMKVTLNQESRQITLLKTRGEKTEMDLGSFTTRKGVATLELSIEKGQPWNQLRILDMKLERIK